jgi:hypothetical protein
MAIDTFLNSILFLVIMAILYISNGVEFLVKLKYYDHHFYFDHDLAIETSFTTLLILILTGWYVQRRGRNNKKALEDQRNVSPATQHESQPEKSVSKEKETPAPAVAGSEGDVKHTSTSHPSTWWEITHDNAHLPGTENAR